MDPALAEGLLKAIQSALSDRRRGDDVVLPPFDPEKNENGAESWCRTIGSIAKDMGWSDITTIAKAGKALKGSALLWYETWDPEEGRTWEEFKSSLTVLYPEKRNLSEKLSRAVLYTSENADSYCEYAREKLRLLKQTKVNFTEEQLIELICGGIQDVTVKMAAHNSRVNTTAELMSIFTTYVKISKKRPLETENKPDRLDRKNAAASDPNIPQKRSRLDIRCFICNKSGHTRSQCLRNPMNFPEQKNIPSYATSQVIQCSFCKKLGHAENVCFIKRRSHAGSKNQNITDTTHNVNGLSKTD